MWQRHISDWHAHAMYEFPNALHHHCLHLSGPSASDAILPTEILEVYKSLQFQMAPKFELPPSAKFFFGGALTLQWTKNEIEWCHMSPTEKLPLMPASVLPKGMSPRACSNHSWPAISGRSKLCCCINFIRAHQSEMRPFGNHSSLEASCIWTVAMSKCGHLNITIHPECCTV